MVKYESGDVDGRQIIVTWSVNEFGLYTQVSGK